MSRRHAALIALTTGLLLPLRALHPQSTQSVLAAAVRSYQNLNLDDAAGFLARALAFAGRDALSRPDRAKALMYLAATELLRDHHDSAFAVSRRLAAFEPRYRPSELAFPPRTIALYDSARRATPAVFAAAPTDTALRAGEALVVRLFASTYHQIQVDLTRESGAPLRTLYTGPIADSLDVRWDGRDSSGATVTNGDYRIAVESRDARGRRVRSLRLPLTVSRVVAETLPSPACLGCVAVRAAAGGAGAGRLRSRSGRRRGNAAAAERGGRQRKRGKLEGAAGGGRGGHAGRDLRALPAPSRRPHPGEPRAQPTRAQPLARRRRLGGAPERGASRRRAVAYPRRRARRPQPGGSVTHRGAVVGLAASLCAAPLASQSAVRLSAAGEGATVRARSLTPAGRERLDGFLVVGDGTLARGRGRLRLRYGQGRLSADSTGVPPRSLTEGEALLGVAALPWLDFWAGPHARSYVTDFGNQRWLFWEAGASASVSLVPGQLHSFLDGWVAVAGRVNVPEEFGSARGAAGGVLARIARPALWLRLTYRIDQARLAAGRRETVEVVAFSLGRDLR